MKLLVTGAAGMLGRDVMLAAGNAGHDVVGFGRAELDVTDPAALEKKFDLERPDVVINCAAWTDVDGAEEAEEAAFAVNGTGAGNVAAAAAGGRRQRRLRLQRLRLRRRQGRPLRGERPARRRSPPTAAPSWPARRRPWPPTSATSSSARPGCSGSAAPTSSRRCCAWPASHDEVLVVRDQVGSPTYTWHLAYGIVRLIEGIEFGIHHMAAAGQCSWYEFAREIFEQAKVECKVLSVTTEEFGRPAPRPPFSALTSQREHAIRLPSWQDGLAGYLAQRQAEKEAA